MPYVILDGSIVTAILENPIDGVTTFQNAGSDGILLFNGRIDKYKALKNEFADRDKTVTIDTFDWDLSEKYSLCFMLELMTAYEGGATDVDLCDADGALHTYLVADAKTLSDQISTYRRQLNNNNNSLFASIGAATTIGELNAIDVSAGWPVAP